MTGAFRRAGAGRALLRAVLVVLLTSACANPRAWRSHEPPWTPATLDGAFEARVRHPDGTETHLYDVRAAPGGITGTTVEGSASELDRRTYAFADLAGLETCAARQADADRSFKATGIVVLVILLGIVVFAAVAVTSGSFVVF
jgi:hypothetical protein